MSSSLLGTTINDQYLLTDILGEGGMGIVFKAEDLNLNNRLCAIKLLKGHTTDPHEVKRFEAELQIISRLRSPHVVQVLNKGYFEGHRLYIVMELLEGEPLSALIKREGALKVKRAVQIAKGVLAGLSEAHEYGVIHRDLKPANIFITRSRAQDEITKVLDFGIAKDTNKDDTTGLTSASMIIGTPKYMAPEQFMKLDTDPRTDLYAVGLLLYQMLAGEPPYLASSDLIPATLKSMPSEFKVGWLHLNAEPKPLPVAPPLWDLCQRLLHKEPEQRPESAAEVIAELGYILEGMETGSGPYSVTLGGPSPLSQGQVAGGYSSGEFYTTPSGQHVAINAQMMTPPTLEPPTPTPSSQSGPYPQHISGQYMNDLIEEETEFDSLEMIELDEPSKGGKLKFISLGLVVVAIAGFGVMQAKKSKSRSAKTCSVERLEITPPGVYKISRSVFNARNEQGGWIPLGQTGKDGKFPQLLRKPCGVKWLIQVDRARYQQINLTLNPENGGGIIQRRVHKLEASPDVKPSSPDREGLKNQGSPSKQSAQPRKRTQQRRTSTRVNRPTKKHRKPSPAPSAKPKAQSAPPPETAPAKRPSKRATSEQPKDKPSKNKLHF